MSARGSQGLKPLIYLMVAVMALTAPAARAGERPAVVRAAAPGAIELPGGERVELALPAGAALSAVEPLAEGWIAAATRPAGAGRRLALLAALPGAPRAPLAPVEIAAPPAAGRLQAEPLPLVEDGRLAGLVWLEGDEARRFAVRSARWDGAAWTPPRTVSAAGPGSQLALAAARLADGSWLLAWSAFDGHDDEIVWSRERNGVWSKPRRVDADNGVPDITPALTLTPSPTVPSNIPTSNPYVPPTPTSIYPPIGDNTLKQALLQTDHGQYSLVIPTLQAIQRQNAQFFTKDDERHAHFRLRFRKAGYIAFHVVDVIFNHASS